MTDVNAIRPRTQEERRAYVAGAASALNDVERVGLVEARRIWKLVMEIELEMKEPA